MTILILSIYEQFALVGTMKETPKLVQKAERVRHMMSELIFSRKIDLICEESNPSYLSIAQLEAFNHNPRIPWRHIDMTPQQRLEVGIWQAVAERPFDLGPHNPEGTAFRIPEDDIREEFFKSKILEAMNQTGATSVLVICGDAHADFIKTKLEGEGFEVETNRNLTPVKRWEYQGS
jgi:hypothetical protein